LHTFTNYVILPLINVLRGVTLWSSKFFYFI